VRHYQKPQEWLDEPRGLPAARGNVLPVVLGLIGIGAVVCAMWALGPAGGEPGERLASCVPIVDDRARLACYDQIATLHPPAKGAFAPAQIHREGSQ
jgi:hypothetical protein